MKKPTNQQSVAILVCRRAFRSHTDERNAVRKALAPLIVPDRVASVNDKRPKSAAPFPPEWAARGECKFTRHLASGFCFVAYLEFTLRRLPACNPASSRETVGRTLCCESAGREWQLGPCRPSAGSGGRSPASA